MRRGRLWTRRRTLAAGAAAVTGLAGCNDQQLSFEVDDVTANQTSVYTGEPINVSATVTNSEPENRTYTANLTVDGEVTTRKNVSVSGDGNRTVAFTHRFEQPGNHTVGFEAGDPVTVTVERAVVVSEASLQQETIGAGDVATVTATVRNRAKVPRSQTIPLSIDGKSETETTVELDAGGVTRVSFQPGFVRPGAYELAVGDTNVGRVSVADSWRQFGYTGANTGHETQTRGPTSDVTRAWTHEFPQGSFSSPAVVGDTVYIGDGNPYAEDRGGALTALATTDGTTQWRHQLDQDVYTTPTVAEGVVVVATQRGVFFEESATGTVVGLDTRDGTEHWRLDAGMPVASPIADDDTVYVAGGNSPDQGSIWALDPRTGTQHWNTRLDAPVWAPPAVADRTVYVGDMDGIVHALDADTGEERWTYDTASQVQAALTVGDDAVYVPCAEQEPFSAGLHSISADDGRERWRAETDDYVESSPAVAGNTVVVGVGLSIRAFHTRSGEVLWQGPDADVGTGTSSAPAIADGTVYVGMQDSVHAFALDSGEPQWSLPGKRSTTSTLSPAVLDGRVYVPTGFNAVSALTEP